MNVILEPVLAHMKSSGEIARLVEHQILNITLGQRFEPHVWKGFFFFFFFFFPKPYLLDVFYYCLVSFALFVDSSILFSFLHETNLVCLVQSQTIVFFMTNVSE